jgi:hypothetical protein
MPGARARTGSSRRPGSGGSNALEESGRVIVQSGKRIDQVLTEEQRAVHAEAKKQFRAGLKKALNIDLPDE